MQNILDVPMVTSIVISSAVIILFTIAYVVAIVSSNKRIIDEQQKKIDEIRKSEQHYKALFDNSLAGMLKFSTAPLIVFEANRTILDMFNVDTVYDLQRVFSEFPNGYSQAIETSLKTSGSIDAYEIEFPTANGIKRRFLFSARKEETDNVAHAVVVLMTSEKMVG